MNNITLKTVTERIHFRLFQMPCCGFMVCYINSRLPSYCPNCGKYVFAEIKSCVLDSDNHAMLSHKVNVNQII